MIRRTLPFPTVCRLALCTWILLTLAMVVPAASAADPPYKQTENLVFAETDGVGLLMDIFTPTGPSNGLAIVDVASGAWHSDRGKINDHKKGQFFDIFCGHGYTVFAIRPGSISKFSMPEMAKNVKKGIEWVKAHAQEYKIDPDRLGLTGALAGGHLASLVAVTADEKSAVKACGVFFPPTDFLNFRGQKIDPDSPDETKLERARKFVFPSGGGGSNAKEIVTSLREISPTHMANSKSPPFLIIHGDADPIVPLEQSQFLQNALQGCGVGCELIVKKGGGHPWFTIHEEVKVLADWFDKQLASK